jgi:polysaccharide biosynthesis transport protein
LVRDRPLFAGAPGTGRPKRRASLELTMGHDIHFHQLVRILNRRRGFIFAIAVLGAVLAGVGALLIPPKYTAKAQIVIEPQQTGLVGRPATIVVAPTEESAVETQVAMLVSHDQLRRVLDDLAKDPLFLVATPTELGTNLWSGLATRLRRGWLMAIARASDIRPLPAEDPEHAMVSASRELTFDEFERRLNVHQERGSFVIAVSFTSTSPERAAAAANRTAQLYVESQAEQKRAYTGHELSWLSERVPELKSEVERAEATVQSYRLAHGLTDANRTDVIDQQLSDLNRQLTLAESDLAGRRARAAYLRSLRRSGSGVDALIDNLNSPMLIELRRQELTLLQSEAEAATTLDEKHPKMQLLRSQLQEVRQKIGREIDRAVDNLENEAQIADAQLRSVQQRLAAVQAVSSTAREAEVRLRELEREAAASRQLYENLLQRQKEVREQHEISAPDVRILSLAEVPQRPSSPTPLLFVLPALIVFSICGSLLAVARERLDQGLRSERNVNEALGLPCLGLVPRLRRVGRRRPHHYLLERPFAAYTETIRSIFASLQLAPQDRLSKAMLISSSIPGEGKTTLAVSLAAYAAVLGRRVLLVDLDFRHPAILRELGGTAETGGLELPLRNHPCLDAVQRIPGLELDYLPVQRHPTDPLALFIGEQMPCLLRQLRESYDCLIVDSPPVLAVSEARLLAAMVDKVIFVVKWGSTKRHVAQNAINLLRHPGLVGKGDIDLAGVVVTQVDLKQHARYGYGDTGEYFHRYRKYYRDRGKGPDKRPRQIAGWSGRPRSLQAEGPGRTGSVNGQDAL